MKKITIFILSILVLASLALALPSDLLNFSPSDSQLIDENFKEQDVQMCIDLLGDNTCKKFLIQRSPNVLPPPFRDEDLMDDSFTELYLGEDITTNTSVWIHSIEREEWLNNKKVFRRK